MNRFELAFLLRYPRALRALNFSFSNEGEDQALLKEIGPEKRNGFYVDVGANDPINYSNTLGFYLRGWHGINIDAMPGSKEKFDKVRKRDINLEMGVGLSKEPLTYYSFNESALNTFDFDMAKFREKEGFTCISKQEICVEPLSEILDKYLPNGQEIDILDVDVEGMDYQVLKSNNWDIYRPKYVLAEAIGKTFSDVYNGEITHFLQEVGYSPFLKSVGTIFYINDD